MSVGVSQCAFPDQVYGEPSCRACWPALCSVSTEIEITAEANHRYRRHDGKHTEKVCSTAAPAPTAAATVEQPSERWIVRRSEESAS